MDIHPTSGAATSRCITKPSSGCCVTYLYHNALECTMVLLSHCSLVCMPGCMVLTQPYTHTWCMSLLRQWHATNWYVCSYCVLIFVGITKYGSTLSVSMMSSSLRHSISIHTIGIFYRGLPPTQWFTLSVYKNERREVNKKSYEF